MTVIEVEQTDIINDLEVNALIFNKETHTYFKKDSSVELTEPITFRDAILGVYREWSRNREKEVETDFIKYYDNNDDVKLLTVYNETDELKSKEEARTASFSTDTVYDTMPTADRDAFIAAKTTIGNDYLTSFAKVVYVDQSIGNDMNDGTEGNPVKTIRRAEALIIENTAIVIAAGIYDLTRGNKRSNKRYCVSGLAGNYYANSSLTVEYINPGNVGDVVMVVDTAGLDFESRDLTFINGIHNSNSKVIGIVFKMEDDKKKTAYSATIARGSEGVQLIDCVFDLEVSNGNVVYFKLTGRDSVVFKNCIIDFKKQLNGLIYDRPYAGKYELENCFINQAFQNKIETYDLQAKDVRSEVSILSNLNTKFF